MCRRWPLIPPLLLGLFVPLLSSVDCLNIDLHNVIKIKGVENVHFGASAALHQHKGENWALFGAPQDRDDFGVVTGTLYGCPIVNLKHDAKCEKVISGNAGSIKVRSRTMPMKSENMSFGMTMEYDPSSHHVSVCAPRTTLPLVTGRNVLKDLQYFTVGACYVYNETFAPLKRLTADADFETATDINDYDKFNVLHHINSMRELGFSISVKQGKHVVGAPGYQDWSGKSVTFPSGQDSFPFSTTPVMMRDTADFAGYSIEQITINKTEYIVHGAPRRNNVKGEVILAEPGATPNRKTNIYLSGTQTGEYFGAAVAVADVNCDGFDDLLVGAPFNSPTEEVPGVSGTVTIRLSKGNYDRGAVYVFLGKENDLDRFPKILYPEEQFSGGRFGSVIRNIGDLDRDGCDDIVIGAPFEGIPREDPFGRPAIDHSGAIYIFRGSQNHGVSNENRVRITPYRGLVPEEWRNEVPVRGFGYSISKGLDVTGDGNPDFAVGAVLTGQGFVYRSQPVIIMEASMEGHKDPIPQEGGKCVLGDRKDYFCFDLNICFKYRLPPGAEGFEPDAVRIHLLITADYKSSSPRAILYKRDHRSPSVNFSIYDAVSPEERCIQLFAFVLPNPNMNNVLEPIDFRLMYELDRDGVKEGYFCAKCPVFYSTAPVFTSVTYKVNCTDPACAVALKLQASIEGVPSGQAIAIGREEPLSLKIEVESSFSGDIAFRPEVIIILKSGLTFNNPDKCNRIDGSKLAISCLLDDQLPAGQNRSLTVKLQLDQYFRTEHGHEKPVVLQVALKTASKDRNAQKNNVTLRYPLEQRADLGISGHGLVENVIFKKNTSEIKIDHTYTVTKYLESPMGGVELTVLVPVSRKSDTSQKHSFVTISEAETSGGHACESLPFNRAPRSADAPKSASLTLPTATVRQLTIDCQAFSCRLFKCSLGTFYGDRLTDSLRLHITLNISELIDQVRVIPESIIFRSDALIARRNGDPIATNDPNPKPKSASIQTSLVRDGKPLGRGIDWWWLLLAVLLGLIVVSIMFYGLYKCGFFKRNSRDDLNELQKEPQTASPILGSHHSPINNMVDVDDNDNSATFHDSKV